MQKVLEGLPDQHLIHYMNDAVSLDSLILLTEELLNKIQTFGFKINPDKTKINETGISIPQKYLDKIQALPTPKTPKQVQTFLGLANWCSRFFVFFRCYKAVNNLGK